MRIKINSVDDLRLKNALRMYDVVIRSKSVFKDDQKYYPKIFAVQNSVKIT